MEYVHTIAPASTELLKRAYAAFNARDLDGALATMRPDVIWPNGMEGGVVHGHDGVRAYWTRQWGMIDPRVDPVRFSEDQSGRIAVSVHQSSANSPARCFSIAWSSTSIP